MPHAQSIAEAAAGRLPFWGGAIAYQGELKDRVLANGRALRTPTTSSRRFGTRPSATPGADLLQKMTYLELKQRLAELLLMRVDKMTMATSVEARVPFLDHELVEFAIALPPEMKVRDGVGKYLLKKAVDGPAAATTSSTGRSRASARRSASGSARTSASARGGRSATRRSPSAGCSTTTDRRPLGGAPGRPGDWAFQLWNIYNVSAWHDYWVAGRVPTG